MVAQQYDLFTFIYLFVCLFIYFWPHLAACRILVPQPGIEPMPPAVEAQSPNHWTAHGIPLNFSHFTVSS